MSMDSREALRRLTIGDRSYYRSLLAAEDPAHGLDGRSVALLRLGATMMAASAGQVWEQRVSDALESGLDFDDLVSALIILTPTIGIDRSITVAPELARALGYDIDAALERLDV